MFRKKKKYSTIQIKNSSTVTPKKRTVSTKPETQKKTGKKQGVIDPKGIVKCPSCKEVLLDTDIKRNLNTCHLCNHHFRMTARNRIKALVDQGSFIEMDANLTSSDPLEFPDYKGKIETAQKKSNETEGVITGECLITGFEATIAVMEPHFMMGSMGSVVGEKITRTIEKAIEKDCPAIVFSASGGARMQEGILSLMQMAKTSAALAKLGESGNLFISVLTDPTTGGVTASFAMLGDIILAEPKALIGFAGPRVIEQTIRQTLPNGFQRSEFLLERGFVDKIIARPDMRNTLSHILKLHQKEGA